MLRRLIIATLALASTADGQGFPCNGFLSFLNIDQALNCFCSVGFRFGAIDVTVQCSQPEGDPNFCFGSLFCGEASFELIYSIPGGLKTGTLCIENTQVDPNDPVNALSNFCLTAQDRRGIGQGFRRCSVDIEGLQCTCKVCEGGYSYTIDCGDGKPFFECFGFNSLDG